MSSSTNNPAWLSCLTNNGLPRRRDGPWAWLLMVFFFLAAIILGGLNFGYGVILPVLMVSLNENRERTALVGSLRMGITVFSCVFSSHICEQYTCRIANGLGLVLMAVGLVLSSLCRSVYLLYFTYSLLTGIGGSLTYVAGFIIVRQYFHKRYSLAIGIASAGAGVGTLIIGPVMHVLMDSFGWQNTFRIIAGAIVFLLFELYFMDPNVEGAENNNQRKSVEEKTSKEIVKKPGNSFSNGNQIQRKLVLGFLDLSVWKFPEYTISVIAIFVGSFGHYIALTHMVKFSEELSVSNGSTLFVFFGSATFISRLISGRLCDVSFIEPRYVHQAGAILSGVSTILLSFAQTYTHLAIFAVFYGIADGAFRVTLNILFMNTVDAPRRPAAFGQANMVTSASVSAGPAIAGLMADKMGSYIGAFYMAGIITILGGAILFFHLCFFKRRDEYLEQIGTEFQSQDCTGVGNIADHRLSCSGPGIQLDDESQTTTF